MAFFRFLAATFLYQGCFGWDIIIFDDTDGVTHYLSFINEQFYEAQQNCWLSRIMRNASVKETCMCNFLLFTGSRLKVC